MGGDCLNTGCVPSKALIRSARVARRRCAAPRDTACARRARRVRFRRGDGARAARGPHGRAARLGRALHALGVECLQGEAQHHLALDGGESDGKRTLTTRASSSPPARGRSCRRSRASSSASVLTSDTVWDLRELPQRLVVLGGGPIGCELAQCLRAPRLAGDAGRDAAAAPVARGSGGLGDGARAASRAEGIDVLHRPQGDAVRVEGAATSGLRARRPRGAHRVRRAPVRAGPRAEHRGLRARGARHPGHARRARWRRTNTCRRSIRTSTRAATSPGPTSSRTPRRTRRGTRR